MAQQQRDALAVGRWVCVGGGGECSVVGMAARAWCSAGGVESALARGERRGECGGPSCQCCIASPCSGLSEASSAKRLIADAAQRTRHSVTLFPSAGSVSAVEGLPAVTVKFARWQVLPCGSNGARVMCRQGQG